MSASGYASKMRGGSCVVLVVGAIAACGTLQGVSAVASSDAGAGADASGPDAEIVEAAAEDSGGVRRCSSSTPFGATGTVATFIPGKPRAVRLGDANEIFAAHVPVGGGQIELLSGKLSGTDTFSDDKHLAPSSFGGKDTEHPAPLPGGLQVVFESNGPGSLTKLWWTERASPDSDFAMTANVTAVAGVTGADEQKDPYYAGGHLYWTEGSSPQAIWSGVIAAGTITGPHAQLTTSANVKRAVVSQDELEILFSLDTGSGYVIHHATRTDTAKAFDAATSMVAVGASGGTDEATWLSADGCELWVILDVDNASSFMRYRRLPL